MKKILSALALLLFLENPFLAEDKNAYLNYDLTSFFRLKKGNAIINLGRDTSSCNVSIGDFCMNYYYVKKDNANIIKEDSGSISDLYVWKDSGTIMYVSTKDNIEHIINNDSNALDFLSALKEFCSNRNKNEFKVLNNGKIYSLSLSSSSIKGYDTKIDVSKLNIQKVRHIYLKTKNTENGRIITDAKIERSFYNSINAKLNENK